MYLIVLNAIPGLLVENRLILQNDFLCPACNVTCAFGVRALQSFRDFSDDETSLLVQKNFIFTNQPKIPIHYVKVEKYQGLPCLVDPALVRGISTLMILNSKNFK